MTTPAPASYAGYRFPAEIITQGFWLYFRWPAQTAYTGTGRASFGYRCMEVPGQRRGQGGPTRQSVSTKQPPDQKTDAAVEPMMAIVRAVSEEDPKAGLDGFLLNPLSIG